MAEYRLYHVGRNGRLSRAHDLVCADDAEAIRVAAQHAKGLDLELWDRGRLVKRIPAHPPGSARP